MSLLVVLEPLDGTWHRHSLETLAAGQQLGQQLGLPVRVAVFGRTLAPAAVRWKLDRVYTVEHELLSEYTADGYTAALEALVRHAGATCVLLPHTYQVRDYAPKLAARFGAMLVSDVTRFRVDGPGVVWTRQIFQGKLNVDLRCGGPPPHFVSIQAGAFRSDALEAGQAVTEAFTPELSAAMIRTRPQAPFRDSQRTIDLSAAQRIIGVGRGIKEKDNLRIVEELARVLDAEIAASRPVCDNGWLPMERQVGSSGQTVAPKLYIAVGVSGAIQHLVGMKGSKIIVAINKDPGAPIFEAADYGIVGDLHEIVPALTDALRSP